MMKRTTAVTFAKGMHVFPGGGVDASDHAQDMHALCIGVDDARASAELGIELNPRKTRVVKLSRGFTWLKKRIFYTETGRIVVKPCRDSITRERRKLKKMARMVADGVMTPEQVERSYQSWRGGMKRLDAHRSVLAMDALYRSLFENLAREGGVPIVLSTGQCCFRD